MTKPVLLSVSFCLLVLFQGSLGRLNFQQQNQCQLSRINALEPDNHIQSEAGTIESWNPNHDQLQCAGVAVTRHIIEPNGLLLPSYSNAPQLIYIVQGRGVLGAMFSGCAETFQESQGSRGSSGSARQQEQHHKIHRLRRGDIIALPAGVASWSYNDGSERLIAVTVYDTANHANQLDNNARNFYLAGNPQDELRQQFMGRRGEYGQSREYPSSSQGKQGSCNNLFCGMDSRMISEAFNIDEQLARKLQSENDFRGNIVRVEGQLEILRPSRTQKEIEEQQQYGYERRETFYGGSNGIEETFCTMRLKENIADPSQADVFVPEVGRMSTVNSHNLPVLKRLQLSASYVVLQNSAVRLPHWHMNAHSILYAVRGQAEIQVVDENGNSVFNGPVREGQVLTVPQNFMVVKQAERRGFEYVAFKTNDNAMSSDVAGRTSAILGMPVEVLANAFRISVEEAQKLKNSRQETTFASSRSRSGRVAEWLQLLKQF